MNLENRFTLINEMLYILKLENKTEGIDVDYIKDLYNNFWDDYELKLHYNSWDKKDKFTFDEYMNMYYEPNSSYILNILTHRINEIL